MGELTAQERERMREAYTLCLARGLKEARAKTGLTQVQTAQRAGCSVGAVRRMESGRHDQLFYDLRDVCGGLGADWKDLMATAYLEAAMASGVRPWDQVER